MADRELLYSGINGEIFHLTGDRADEQGVIACETTDGFWHAKKSVLVTSTSYSRGGRAGRTVWESREFDLVVRSRFGKDDNPSLEESWWAAWSTDETGVLTVFGSESGARRLTVQLRGEPKYETTREPGKGTYRQDTLPLIATDPFYRGAEIVHEEEFAPGETKSFLVVYDGDVPAWPVFTATAGSWKLPDGEEVVELENMSHDFTVFTDPERETLIDETGLPLYHKLAWQAFRTPVSRGVHEISVTSADGGTLRMSIPQLFERPWG